MSTFNQYKGLSKSVYVFFIARTITSMGAFIWPMLTIIMSIKLEYDETQIATFFLIVSSIYIPGAIIGGKLADRFNKRIIIALFDLISVTGFFICAFISPGLLMVIIFAISGLFANMEGPSYEALIAEISHPEEREKVYSLSYLGHNLGLIVGASLGGFLVANHLQLAFLIDGITTLASTFLIVFFLFPANVTAIPSNKENLYEKPADNIADTGIKVLFRRKAIFVQIIIVCLATLVYDQWTFLLPIHLTRLFGATKGSEFYGWLASFNALIVIIATPIITRILKKTTELPKILLGSLGYGISFFLLIVFDAFPIFIVFMLIFTFCEIVNVLGFGPYFSRRIPKSHRGRINSYRMISSTIGSILGKLMIGTIVHIFGFSSGYFVLVIIAITVVLIAYVNYRIDKVNFPALYQV